MHTAQDELPQHRAVFNAEIAFSNGGGLTARGFRVDVPGPQVSEDEITHLFLTSLDLLLAETAVLSNVEIIEEQHKGTRGGPSDPKNARDADREPERVILGSNDPNLREKLAETVLAGAEFVRWTREMPALRDLLVRIDVLPFEHRDALSNEDLRSRLRAALSE